MGRLLHDAVNHSRKITGRKQPSSGLVGGTPLILSTLQTTLDCGPLKSKCFNQIYAAILLLHCLYSNDGQFAKCLYKQSVFLLVPTRCDFLGNCNIQYNMEDELASLMGKQNGRLCNRSTCGPGNKLSVPLKRDLSSIQFIANFIMRFAM